MNWESLVDYWFDAKHQHYWFQSTPDDDRQIYQELISSQKCTFPPPPPGFEPEADTLKSRLGKVIYYDQILRHLYRTTNILYPQWALDYAIQLAYPHLPLSSLSNKSKKKKSSKSLSNQSYFEHLPPYQQCFFWMPLRHSNRLDFLWKLHDWVQKQRSKIETDNAAYRRCYYATVKRITNILQSQFQKSFTTQKLLLPYHSSNTIPQKSLLDWGNLLDSESTYKSEVIPKVFQLLNSNLSSQSRQLPDSLSPLFKVWQKEYTRYTAPYHPLIISLSGGVDSMVTLVIAKLMGHRVSAVMINYHNREEAATEQTLVENWCQSLNIPLFVREIKEISRSSEDREFYESHTRTIRFKTYTQVQDYQNATFQSGSKIPVVLGHNYDDTKENALNNIRHHKHYGCLGKMQPFEQYDQVTLFRPFLTIPKKILIQAARFLQLPYFIDSTPEWSERGRLRDTVIPTLEHYDPEFFTRIFEFSYQFKELSNVIDTQVVDKILQSVNNRSYPIQITHYNCASLYVWKKVFGSLDIVCTHKALNSLIERWKKSKKIKKSFQQILSSKIRVSVSNTTLSIHHNSFPDTISETKVYQQPETITHQHQSLPSLADIPSLPDLPLHYHSLPSLTSKI